MQISKYFPKDYLSITADQNVRLKQSSNNHSTLT